MGLETLQTGGNWVTDPGSYTAFGLVLIGLLGFYTGRVVTKARVDEIKAEFEVRYNLMKEQRDYHRTIADKFIDTNAEAIRVIQMANRAIAEK